MKTKSSAKYEKVKSLKEKELRARISEEYQTKGDK